MDDYGFDFEVPLSVFEKADAPKGKQRRIGGIVSLETQDRQDEIVLQRGLDFSDFRKNGWFNDNHTKDTTGIVGYPEEVQFFQRGAELPDGSVAPAQGHWVEGYLLEGYKKADEIWDLGQALQKTNRRLGFSVEGKILQRSGPKQRTIAKALVRNVAITNCFPGDVEVSGAAEDITRRFYSGAMVEIKLATGEKLTGTPNHPIFTNRGWIALGDLREGFDCIGRFDRNLVGNFPDSGLSSSFPGIVPHDKQDMPSTLNELFDFASDNSSGFNHGVCSIREGDFHGDVLINGDVNVVPVKGELKRSMDFAFFKNFGKNALPTSDKEAFILARKSALFYLRLIYNCAAAGDVCSLRQLLSLGRSSIFVPEQLFVMAIAGYSMALSNIEYSNSADAILFSDSGRALSSSVSFSDLALKRSFQFSGHVFNLSTERGWYSANGIVAHNCPVNTGARMEVLAKSLLNLERSLGSGATSNVKPTGPQIGMTAGQLFTAQSLEQDSEKKKRKRLRGMEEEEEEEEGAQKGLSESEALAIIRSRYPQISSELVGRILDRVRSLKSSGHI